MTYTEQRPSRHTGTASVPVVAPAPGGAVRRPRYVTEWDLAGAWTGIPHQHPDAGVPYHGVRLLVRLGTEPLGTLDLDIAETDRAVAAVWESYRIAVTDRLRSAGLSAPDRLTTAGLGLTDEQLAALPWLVERRAVLAEATPISVVMCTRGRPERLAAALAGVTTQDYPQFEVILVDNAPTDESNRAVVESRSWPVPVRYVVEPRGGLSWARNAGFEVSTGDIVCFIDDDETPDRYWLAEYARAFHRYPAAGLACGSIHPRRLDTDAEQYFEQLGGHSKGRGFGLQAYDAGSHSHQHPLYPLPPFGAGGNMAFRRHVLRTIGRFDVALGAGTPARGAEDTAAIAQAMLSGFTLVWQPSALVWHSHFTTFEGAERQLSGYAIGLTAFYTKMLLEDPRRLPAVLRLLPRALTDMVIPSLLPHPEPDGAADLPPGLASARWRGMVFGPRAYLRSRAVQRALAGGAR